MCDQFHEPFSFALSRESVERTIVVEHSYLSYLALRLVSKFHYLSNHHLSRCGTLGTLDGSILRGGGDCLVCRLHIGSVRFTISGILTVDHLAFAKHQPRDADLREATMNRLDMVIGRRSMTIVYTRERRRRYTEHLCKFPLGHLLRFLNHSDAIFHRLKWKL